VEPGVGEIQQKRGRPDARQSAQSEEECASQCQAGGGKHGACIAGRNGQRETGGTQRDIGQPHKEHPFNGKGTPGRKCGIAAGF